MTVSEQGGKRYNHSLGVPIIFSVTGHVDIPDSCRGQVSDRIRSLFKSFRALYPHTELMLLSGMAEGADRIAVRTALECDVHICPVLPRPPEEYAESFRGIGYGGRREESVSDFMSMLDDERVYTPCVLPVSKNKSDKYRNLGAYLIANSHVLISIWDGNRYREGNGGTYDTVRMAYEGIDNDLYTVSQPMSPDTPFLESTGARYLNVAEDCLIYWIQTERSSDQRDLDSRGFEKGPGFRGASCFIPPRMMAEEVRQNQSYRPNWIRRHLDGEGGDRVRLLQKAGVPVSDLDSPMLVTLGSSEVDASDYRTLPLFYDRQFDNIDSLNRDAGATEGGYEPGSSMDPDTFRLDAKKWSTRSSMLAETYKGPHGKEELKGCREIKERGLMDCMALRYMLASSLSRRFQKSSDRTVWWIVMISLVTAFCFHMFIMSNTAVFLVMIYGILLMTEKALNLKHLNSAEYRKHVEYRCVAECTRANYYWGLMGINDSAYTSCYGFLRNETFWIRSVLLSWSSYFMNDYDMSSVPFSDRREAVIVSWVQSQTLYHRNKRVTNERLYRRYDIMMRIATVSLFVLSIVLTLGSVVSGSLFYDPIRVFEVHVIEANDLDLDTIDITLMSLLKLAMIFLTLSTGYIMSKRSLISGGTPAQIDANIKIFELTRVRAEKIRSEAESFTVRRTEGVSDPGEKDRIISQIESERDINLLHLVHELGIQCIDENNDWVFNTKVKDVSTLGRQDEMEEIAKG